MILITINFSIIAAVELLVRVLANTLLNRRAIRGMF